MNNANPQENLENNCIQKATDFFTSKYGALALNNEKDGPETYEIEGVLHYKFGETYVSSNEFQEAFEKFYEEALPTEAFEDESEVFAQESSVENQNYQNYSYPEDALVYENEVPQDDSFNQVDFPTETVASEENVVLENQDDYLEQESISAATKIDQELREAARREKQAQRKEFLMSILTKIKFGLLWFFSKVKLWSLKAFNFLKDFWKNSDKKPQAIIGALVLLILIVLIILLSKLFKQDTATISDASESTSIVQEVPSAVWDREATLSHTVPLVTAPSRSEIDQNTPFVSTSELVNPEFVAKTLSANKYLVQDITNGETLLARNEDNRNAIGSMGKIMLGLVAIENLDADKLAQDFLISSAMIDDLRSKGALLTGFKIDSKVKVLDLLIGTLITNGADSALGLAQATFGTEEACLAKMNEKAQELGLANTHFSDVTGIDNDGNYSTPKDLALLLQYAYQNQDFINALEQLDRTAADGTYMKNSLKYAYGAMQYTWPKGYDLKGGKYTYVNTGSCMVAMVTHKVQDKEQNIIIVLCNSKNTSEIPALETAEYVFQELFKDQTGPGDGTTLAPAN